MQDKTEQMENVKIEDAISIAGYGKFSLFIIFLSGMTMCCSFLSSLDISYLLPAAECDLHLTSSDKGLLGSAFFIGMLFSSLLSGFLADTLGRRYVLLRGLWLNSLCYIFGSFAPNFWTFIASKFISGIVSGPCMVAAYPFVGEYIPADKRAQALMVTSSVRSVALLYSSSVGWLLLQGKWTLDLWFITFTPWRLFNLLCCLPNLFSAILFNFTHESPKFLLTKGKKGDTIKALQRAHSINSGKLPQTYPVASVTLDTDETASPAREKGASGVLKHICDQTLPLFKPPYFLNLMLCLVSVSILLLCTNSIFVWLPEVTNRVAIHKESKEGEFYLCQMLPKEYMTNVTDEVTTAPAVECDTTINTAVFIPNLLMAVFQPSLNILSGFAMPYIDRRLLISTLILLCSAMMFFLNSLLESTVTIFMFGSTAIISGVCNNILSSITIELFPTYIRGMAVSLCLTTGRIGSIVGSHMFSQLIDSQCSLLFHLISGLLLCCSVLPFCFRLRSKAVENYDEEEPEAKNDVI